MSRREIFQTKLFLKQSKKLKTNQKAELKEAIQSIIGNPKIGSEKKGDLVNVWVYKFRLVKQLTLLAYQYDNKSITLLTLGSHENFYRDLKKHLNS